MYDDIGKQNRYRNHCESVCDFKLIYPENNIPPFQIAHPGPINGLSFLYIRCAEDDSIVLNLMTYNGWNNNIWVNYPASITGYTYVYYIGTQQPPPIQQITGLSCGDYYLHASLNNTDPAGDDYNYYSEVFTIVQELSDPTFRQDDPPIFCLWRWHDDIDKCNQNKNHCAAVCNFHLLCGVDSLLPFMFRKAINFSPGYSILWSLVEEDSECEHVLDASLIQVQTVGSYKYIFYNGDAMASDLPCGKFYSKLNIDGNIFYSELIEINIAVNTPETNYILQETAFRILLETGFGMLQE